MKLKTDSGKIFDVNVIKHNQRTLRVNLMEGEKIVKHNVKIKKDSPKLIRETEREKGNGG